MKATMFGRMGRKTLIAVASLSCLSCGNAGSDHPATDSGAGSDVDAQAAFDGSTNDGSAVEAGVDAALDGADASSDTSSGTLMDGGPGCPSNSGGPQCGAPTQCGPVVTTVEVLQSPPTGTGGAITSGLYFLVAETVYRTKPGPLGTIQITYQLAAGTFAERNWQDGFEASPVSGTFTTAGAVFNKSISCPNTSPTYAEGYTATATGLTIYFTPSGGQEVYADVYQLQ